MEPNDYGPRHKHDTQHQAENEAERLAKANPDQCFFLLEPVSLTVKREVDVQRRQRQPELGDDVPF
jgi:hypothetical protein